MDKVSLRLPIANFSTKQSDLTKRFTRIHARDRPFVRSVLLRFGVPSRDVEDLVQEVFVIFWQRLEGIIVDIDPRPWLYTVAAYRASNYRRLCRCTKERFVLSMGDAPELGATEIDPGWMMDAYRSFKRLMRQLSKKVRDVFVAVAFRGQSIHEVAASLRIPTKTAHARMRTARDVVQRLCPFVTSAAAGVRA